MITILDWLYGLIGVPYSSEFEFIFLLIAAVCVVIAFACALSMFIGIVFAIFKK